MILRAFPGAFFIAFREAVTTERAVFIIFAPRDEEDFFLVADFDEVFFDFAAAFFAEPLDLDFIPRLGLLSDDRRFAAFFAMRSLL
jgi:hypothetical protein